jgi:DNA-binding response OmpR family regulator
MADDSPGVWPAATLADLLTQGIRIDLADDGEQALALFFSPRAPAGGYDAIILDVVLAKLPGLEVLRRLRAAGIRTPIMLLASHKDVPEVVAALEAGADDYQVKPIDPRELAERLRALQRRERNGERG